MSLISIFKEKKETNLDAPETTLQHRDIVMRKKFLKKLYEEWYKSLNKIITPELNGKIVEIGSGGGFFKDIYPHAITSDILPLPHCDFCFRAEKMPFENNSVQAIFMIDVLHHIPNCIDFFHEASRVLQNKGKIVMIEPANTSFSRLIYRNLHHEPFDPKTPDWHFPDSGPLSSANGALPWILFNRDIEIFNKNFPELKLSKIELHTPFRYLITGGLSFKSLVPGWSFKLLTFKENLLRPLFPYIAMFQTIIIEKR